MDDSADLSQAAAFWDDITAENFKDGINMSRSEWQLHPGVVAHRRRLLGGCDTVEWLAARLPARVDRALGVGCGTAVFELGLLECGAVGHYDLCDVSATSLEAAAKRAEHLGLEDRITVRCVDVFAIETRNYGLVTFANSLHHAIDVVATVRFVHEILKPGGVLFADEYIGPRRFGYPPEHADLVKALYRALAPELRCQWPELPQPDPADVAAADPTEAAQSDLIVDAVRAEFGEAELAPIYGALPFILWWGLDHDAMWDTEPGRAFTDLLLTLDTMLGSSGALPPYFSLILARRNWWLRAGRFSRVSRYAVDRPEMLEFIPESARAVLDIGCNTGRFGAMLREGNNKLEVVGIESDRAAAEEAELVLDRVVCGTFPLAGPSVERHGGFDVIVFNDVLEHMANPEEALDAARSLLSPVGLLVASIPNVRHVSVTVPLVMRGEWRYEEVGILDSTHLRFFTRKSIRRFFNDNGWRVVRLESINICFSMSTATLRPTVRRLSSLTNGATDGFFALQFAVVARPAT